MNKLLRAYLKVKGLNERDINHACSLIGKDRLTNICDYKPTSLISVEKIDNVNTALNELIDFNPITITKTNKNDNRKSKRTKS